MFIKLNLADDNLFKIFQAKDILLIEPAYPGENYKLRLATDPEDTCLLITLEQACDLSLALGCTTIAHPAEYM